jgi:hypothetical protein
MPDTLTFTDSSGKSSEITPPSRYGIEDGTFRKFVSLIIQALGERTETEPFPFRCMAFNPLPRCFAF